MRHGLKAVFGNHGNDHGGDFDKRVPRMIELFQELNVDLTRIEFKWEINEPERERYDFSEADRLVEALHEGGIEPMMMFYCPPKWAMVGDPEPDEQFFIDRGMGNLHTVVWMREDTRDDFRRFVETSARRYRGKADHWEFWNEPDGMAGPTILRDAEGKIASVRFGGDPVLYTSWLKDFYTAVKAGNPDAVVAAGSLCEPHSYFLEAMYASGAKDYCDAISLHPYPWGDNQIHLNVIKAAREVMVRHGDWDKPIWISEFGWTTGDDFVDPINPKPTTSMLEQAELIEPMFEQIHRLPYVSQFYFFTLNDWGRTPQDPGGVNGFGIVDFYLNKKPSFDTYHAAVKNSPTAPRTLRAPALTILGATAPIDALPGTHAHVPITVRNYLDAAQSLRISVGVSAFNQPEEMFPTVPPGVTHTSYNYRVSALTPPGNYTLYTRIRGQAGDQARDDVLLSVSAPTARFATPPAIDGDLSDWQDRLNINAEGFDAGFGWDEAGLYLAARVRDATHVPGTPEPDNWLDDALWATDSLQLALDPLRDAVRGCHLLPDDSEFLFALTTQGLVMRRYAAMEGRYIGGDLTLGEMAVKARGDVTTYEVFLPWSEIHPGQPQEGDVLGVSLLANRTISGEREALPWGAGIAKRKDPSRFASITLLP